MRRLLALLGLCASLGCANMGLVPLPSVEAEFPAFDSCLSTSRVEHLEFSLCPRDGGFPFGDYRVGTLQRVGSSDVLRFTEAGGGASWELAFEASLELTGGMPRWFGTSSSGPEIELYISEPCSDASNSWFEVSSASGGDLLVAGGRATHALLGVGFEFEIGRRPRQDFLPSRCEARTFECECWEACFVAPLRFVGGPFGADLYPAERTRSGGFEARVFEARRGTGASSCEGAPRESVRWLLFAAGP